PRWENDPGKLGTAPDLIERLYLPELRSTIEPHIQLCVRGIDPLIDTITVTISNPSGTEEKHLGSSNKGLIVEKTDPFDDLDEILGEYANTGKKNIRKEIIVHVDNNSTVENMVDYDMLYET
nr:hypothetical protein [Tanacetum cinerariifolium]